VDYIKDVVTQQLDLAQNNKITKIRELETSTGVADRIASDAITIMP
jgi:hypothetical protein